MAIIHEFLESHIKKKQRDLQSCLLNFLVFRWRYVSSIIGHQIRQGYRRRCIESWIGRCVWQVLFRVFVQTDVAHFDPQVAYQKPYYKTYQQHRLQWRRAKAQSLKHLLTIVSKTQTARFQYIIRGIHCWIFAQFVSQLVALVGKIHADDLFGVSTVVIERVDMRLLFFQTMFETLVIGAINAGRECNHPYDDTHPRDDQHRKHER